MWPNIKCMIFNEVAGSPIKLGQQVAEAIPGDQRYFWESEEKDPWRGVRRGGKISIKF